MALPASRILELRNRLMQVPPERMRALILEGLRLGEEALLVHARRVWLDLLRFPRSWVSGSEHVSGQRYRLPLSARLRWATQAASAFALAWQLL
jgi:hypothetical protein